MKYETENESKLILHDTLLEKYYRTKLFIFLLCSFFSLGFSVHLTVSKLTVFGRLFGFCMEFFRCFFISEISCQNIATIEEAEESILSTIGI